MRVPETFAKEHAKPVNFAHAPVPKEMIGMIDRGVIVHSHRVLRFYFYNLTCLQVYSSPLLTCCDTTFFLPVHLV